MWRSAGPRPVLRLHVASHVSLRGLFTLHLLEMMAAHLHLLVLVSLHECDGSYLRSPAPSGTSVVRHTLDGTQTSRCLPLQIRERRTSVAEEDELPRRIRGSFLCSSCSNSCQLEDPHPVKCALKDIYRRGYPFSVVFEVGMRTGEKVHLMGKVLQSKSHSLGTFRVRMAVASKTPTWKTMAAQGAWEFEATSYTACCRPTGPQFREGRVSRCKT